MNMLKKRSKEINTMNYRWSNWSKVFYILIEVCTRVFILFGKKRRVIKTISDYAERYAKRLQNEVASVWANNMSSKIEISFPG